METSAVKRLKQLEAENRALKKLVAERDLEIDVMKEIARKKCQGSPLRTLIRVAQVANARQRGGSIHRTCQWLSVAPSTM